MSKYTIIYNSLSDNRKGETEAKELDALLKGHDLTYYDVQQYDKQSIVAQLSDDDKLVIAGGDGTLNRFINDTADMTLKNEVYFFPTGTGNDFLSSIGEEKGKLIPLNSYLGNLPTVTVNGKDYKFINGVGYGIDGYCCEVGDKMRETTDKPINYTSIAIKGLLFHFKPVNAKVTVDGKVHRFKKVWLAPTMFGRYYGGGMIPTPDQKRGDGAVSTMVYHNCGKLKALMIFPSIFKGEHVKHTDVVSIFKGHHVRVEFDKPTSLQIDGETILGVTSYTVKI